jgi:hypothetical protein
VAPGERPHPLPLPLQLPPALQGGQEPMRHTLWARPLMEQGAAATTSALRFQLQTLASSKG